ncbi:MAG: NAD(P)-binding domain-containing protein [Halobacteriales archaeon]|nr:NAD(P)-binding domain-containing protein [Halobacteriales archaeon]
MAETQTRVGVVGLGYVGLPLALAMHDAGYDVVGVDIDDDKVDTTPRRYVDGQRRHRRGSYATALDEGLTFTTDYGDLADVDGVSICVPTPLRKTDTPDLSFVIDAAERLAPVVPDGCTVVLESTVYPGATEEALAEILAENGKNCRRGHSISRSHRTHRPRQRGVRPDEYPEGARRRHRGLRRPRRSALRSGL